MPNYVDDVEDLKAVAPAAAPAAQAPPAAPPATTTAAAAPAPAPQPPTPAPQPTVAAQIEEDAPTTKAAVPAQAAGEDYNVEFGDETLMSRSDGLDILRPDKGKTIRFALLTEFVPAKRAYNHFIDKKGSYHCLTGRDKHGVIVGNPAVCCQKLGESQPQIVALALHYTNANPKTGRYEKDATGHYPPIQWEIKFVRLSRSAFRRVSNLTEEEGKPTDIDITMCHRDNNIGYEYNKVSVARWKKNPQLVAEVTQALQPFRDGKKLFSKLGKKATELELKAVLAGAAPASSTDADLNEIDDL